MTNYIKLLKFIEQERKINLYFNWISIKYKFNQKSNKSTADSQNDMNFLVNWKLKPRFKIKSFQSQVCLFHSRANPKILNCWRDFADLAARLDQANEKEKCMVFKPKWWSFKFILIACWFMCAHAAHALYLSDSRKTVWSLWLFELFACEIAL